MPRAVLIIVDLLNDFFEVLASQRARLVVAGLTTHACVSMTVIDAYQRDHETIVAAECIASNDPEHHAVTARYLD